MTARHAELVRQRLDRDPADPYAHPCPACEASALDYCRWPGEVVRPGQWHRRRVAAAAAYALRVREARS